MIPFLTYDLETHKIRRPVAAPKPVCMQWCDRPPESLLDGHLELYSVERARELWTRPVTKVGHNIAFDACVTMASDPDLIEVVFAEYSADRVQCTLLNQKLIDIANGEMTFRKTRGYNLGEVSRRHDIEGIDKDDPWRLRYGELDGIPLESWPQDAKDYAIKDGPAPYIIFGKQWAISDAWEAQYGSPILHEGPARARYDLALYLAKCHGVRTNCVRTELVEKFTKREIERMHDELHTELREIIVEKKRSKNKVAYVEKTLQKLPLVRKDGSKNTKVVKDMVKELFEKRGEEFPTTDSGDVSTEKDTMILAGAGWPAGSEEKRLSEVLIMYADYTTAKNLMNRVEDLKEGFDLPLQPRYDSLLETGRTSSSKSGTADDNSLEDDSIRGIQIQNFPRSFDKRQVAIWKELFPGKPIIGARECLEPREGNVFVLCDYAGAELHALAQNHYNLFGQSSLGEMLNNGVDVLMKFGVEAYEYGRVISYEEAVKLKKQEPYKSWRQAAKPIVYGRPGGMGAKKIVVTARKSYNVILDLNEAKRLIRLYDEMIVEMPAYFAHINSLLGGNQYGLMRQFGSGRWRGGATYSGLANSGFQGLTADGALTALYRVALECYNVPSSPMYGFRIVAFVHDEIVLEGPESRAHDAAMRLQVVMEEAMTIYTPDCPTPADPVVTRIWSKDAGQVWNEDKTILLPWELKEAA